LGPSTAFEQPALASGARHGADRGWAMCCLGCRCMRALHGSMRIAVKGAHQQSAGFAAECFAALLHLAAALRCCLWVERVIERQVIATRFGKQAAMGLQ